MALANVWIITILWMFYGVFNNANCQQTLPDLRYSDYLDRDMKYHLKWDYNATHMEFEVTVQALGYFGFGISKYGTMTPADMVIGWIAGEELYLGDYHTVAGSQAPMIDNSTDWFIVTGYESGGNTTMRFTRQLDTCDEQDEPITSDTMQLIYSYHDADPDVTSGLVYYHGADRRGSKFVLLKDRSDELVMTPGLELYTIDFKNYKFPIPPVGHFRQCIVFNMSSPNSTKSHIVKYEPVISPGNERYVYRIMLYRCNLTEPVQNGRGYECENDAPLPIRSCKNIVANWAMGGQGFTYPDDVGLPFMGDTEPSIYVLEIHYTNFENAAGIEDNSGLRLMYTETLRRFDGGMMELGTVLTNGWKKVLPQAEQKYISRAYCSPRCMNWGFQLDDTPLKIIGVLFQGNDIATKFTLRHYNSAVEKPWIAKDDAFSNFYQEMRYFKTPIDVYRWDTLVLECQYNTTSRQGITQGGWSRIKEICRATIVYYPRKSFDMCLGWSSLDKLRDESGNLTDPIWNRAGDKIIEVSPVENVPEGKAVDYLSGKNIWDRGTKQRVEDAIRQSTERSLCAAIDRSKAYAIDRYTKPRTERKYNPLKTCRKLSLFQSFK